VVQSIPKWNGSKGQKMEIRQIQYFLSIVDTGSFTAAAEENFITQPSLSKIIISLEKELAITLFDRSKHNISLTEAGRAFLRHARAQIDDYKAMLVEMDGYKSSEDSFNVATIPVLPQYGIATLISQFRDKYPQIHFSLEETNGQNILPGLMERRYDLGFIRHNYLDRKIFDFVEMCKDHMLVVVAKTNQHASRSSISLKDLSNDNFIIFDKVTDLHRLIMDECAKANFEPTIFYSSPHKVSVFALVETNIGIALMPSKIFEYYRHPGIITIPLEETIECNIVLSYLINKPPLGAARLFVDFLRQTSEIN
jgi:LysR family transcriptional regulator, transcription activator of glutamate synthase operon